MQLQKPQYENEKMCGLRDQSEEEQRELILSYPSDCPTRAYCACANQYRVIFVTLNNTPIIFYYLRENFFMWGRPVFLLFMFIFIITRYIAVMRTIYGHIHTKPARTSDHLSVFHENFRLDMGGTYDLIVWC